MTHRMNDPIQAKADLIEALKVAYGYFLLENSYKAEGVPMPIGQRAIHVTRVYKTLELYIGPFTDADILREMVGILEAQIRYEEMGDGE